MPKERLKDLEKSPKRMSLSALQIALRWTMRPHFFPLCRPAAFQIGMLKERANWRNA